MTKETDFCNLEEKGDFKKLSQDTVLLRKQR